MASTKTALVIGVGPGLGASLARRFAKGGYNVGLVARSEANLTPVKEDIEKNGGKAIAVPTDVTNFEALAATVEKVTSELGEISVLVFNVAARPPSSADGKSFGKSLLEFKAEEVVTGFKISAASALVAAQAVLPAMVKAGEGSILLTGATAAVRGGKGFSGFAMGKFGLRALGQSLAREFHPQGVHVCHFIIDGIIDSSFIRNLLPQLGEERKLNPDDIADAYWQVHTQKKSAWSHEIDLRPFTEKF